MISPAALSGVASPATSAAGTPSYASCCDFAKTEFSQGSGVASSWRCGSKIGLGSYGCVYKALNTRTGCIAAVKKARVDETSADDCTFRDKLEDELKICKGLRHQHIVSYLGYEYECGHLCIYLEFVSGGSMASILSEFGPLDCTLFRKATLGLLQGLDYLHTRSPPVVHRDIKAANVLVDLNFCVKLADFGCSKHDAVTRSFTTIGSVPWMAPEVIQQRDGHGRKADIWSLGCTLIEMATAEKPWGAGTFDNVIFAMRHIGMSEATPPIPEALPAEAKDLISQCVQRSPEARPWAEELLCHRFLQKQGGSPGRIREALYSTRSTDT